MNTEKNFPENNTQETDRIGFSPVSNGKKPRRKRSLFKSQIFTLIVIAVLIIGLGVGVGIAISRFANTDNVIDTFTESFTSKESGKVTYTYYSKQTETGFVITDEAGNILENYLVDENGNVVDTPGDTTTHIYQTAIGSMLTLTATGKISFYARVDHNGEYVGGDTGARVLIFPRVRPESVSEIFIHNVDKEGTVTEFSVLGEDTNKDKSNDSFYIKNYENSTISPLISSAMCSYAGYTITVKKLSIDFMEDYDDSHKDEPGYVPLLDENGKINFSEYGLDSDNYYELTTTGGEKHRLYIGNAVPDGSGLYVRYSNATEGDRNAVYVIADDPGVATFVGTSISRSGIFLAKPEELVCPQISIPTTLNTYLLVDEFKISKLQADGTYKDLTNFSYVDLALRNYTLNQVHPYIINDPNILSGYILDDALLDQALIDMYDISTLMNASYQESAVANYVKVKKLVKNILPDIDELSSYYDDLVKEIVDAVEKAATEDTELIEILKEYGLDTPENKLFYTPMTFGNDGNAIHDGIPTYIWVSKMTEQKTYYVWAPIYQQILEIGAGYLDMFTYDEFDWASSTVFDANIAFCDSIRVTGTDKNGEYSDILFELMHEYELSFKWDYLFNSGSSGGYKITDSEYILDVTVTEDGELLLTLSSEVDYTVQYKNLQNGEIVDETETHGIEFFAGVSVETIKNYFKYYIDPTILGSLTAEEQKAIESFANQTGNRIQELQNGDLRIAYAGKDDGVLAQENSSYYYVPPTDYVTTFLYDPDADLLRIGVRQTTSGADTEVFSEQALENLIEKIVKNDGAPEFTDKENEEIDYMYKKLSEKQSVQTKIKISSFSKDGSLIKAETYEFDENNETSESSQFMVAFKQFYRTLLYATYKGKVTDEITSGVVGTVLNEQQMEEYKAKGDDCDLKIDIKMCIDNVRYTFRMYNYSVTRSYITANGDGIFYLDRDRTDKLLADAIKASKGDTTIDSTTTH